MPVLLLLFILSGFPCKQLQSGENHMNAAAHGLGLGFILCRLSSKATCTGDLASQQSSCYSPGRTPSSALQPPGWGMAKMQSRQRRTAQVIRLLANFLLGEEPFRMAAFTTAPPNIDQVDTGCPVAKEARQQTKQAAKVIIIRGQHNANTYTAFELPARVAGEEGWHMGHDSLNL